MQSKLTMSHRLNLTRLWRMKTPRAVTVLRLMQKVQSVLRLVWDRHPHKDVAASLFLHLKCLVVGKSKEIATMQKFPVDCTTVIGRSPQEGNWC